MGERGRSRLAACRGRQFRFFWATGAAVRSVGGMGDMNEVASDWGAAETRAEISEKGSGT